MVCGAVLLLDLGNCDLRVELDRSVLLLVMVDCLGDGIREAFIVVALLVVLGTREFPIALGDDTFDLRFLARILSDNSLARARARAFVSAALLLLLDGELLAHIIIIVKSN